MIYIILYNNIMYTYNFHLVLTEDANNPPLPLQRIFPEYDSNGTTNNNNMVGKVEEDFEVAEAKNQKVCYSIYMQVL